MELKENHILILLELSDMKGYSNTQLAEKLEKQTSNMSTLLKELRNFGIIYKVSGRKVIEGKEYSDEPHYINLKYPKKLRRELEFFQQTVEKLFDMKKEDFTEKMLASEYLDRLIKKFGFISVYNILKNHINDPEFNKIVSRCVLSRPAFICEIQRYPDNIRKMSECSESPIIACNLDEDNLIGLLGNFNAIDAVTFYRKTIKNAYGELFRELGGDSLPESIKSFLDLDIYLSPFTSYPINDPIEMLFARPFERLYDDLYVIHPSDWKKVVEKAYIFYSHFIEILSYEMHYILSRKINQLEQNVRCLEMRNEDIDSEYYDLWDDQPSDIYWDKIGSIKNNEKSLDALLKTSILYWNIASKRIDDLYYIWDIDRVFGRSTRYHILDIKGNIEIIDLETDDSALCHGSFEEKKIHLFEDILLGSMENPFSGLRPCRVFYKSGFKVETKSYSELLAEFRSKMLQNDK